MGVQKLSLSSGRSLDYLIAGSNTEDAFPLVYIHGTPSAYPTFKSFNSRCKDNNLKLITFSRAGYGDSTRNPGRKVVDVVDDVKALLDHLGLEKCFVAGWSGGGPHVLACAARLEGCVGALCVAGVAPYYNVEDLDWLAGQGEDNVQEMLATLRGEDECRKFVDIQRIGVLKSDAAGLVEEWSSILPDVDKKVMVENEDFGLVVMESFHEALKHSSDGWVDDNMSFISHWGFELSEINAPVFLYQGSLDLMVPYAHGQWLSKHIPREHLKEHLIEGEGHMSIWLGYMDSMFKELSTLRR